MTGKRMRGCAIAALMIAALSGGCSRSPEREWAGDNAAPPIADQVEESDSIRADELPAKPLPTDRWVGRWIGPEGLFLDIQPSRDGGKGHYTITNRSTLDHEADYSAVAVGNIIRFTRDGKQFDIRTGSGSETGFKYLAGKKACLIVVTGQEGYCR